MFNHLLEKICDYLHIFQNRYSILQIALFWHHGRHEKRRARKISSVARLQRFQKILLPMKSPRILGLSYVSYVNPLLSLPSRLACRFAKRLSRRLARATFAKAAESARLARPGACAGPG